MSSPLIVLPQSKCTSLLQEALALIQHLSSFLEHLPPLYAYLALGGIILLESTGVPLPAESLLIFASLYASHTHHLTPENLIIAAISGAVIGDNIGYLIGYQLGYRLMEKHGHKVGLHYDRIVLGRYLFRRYGGIGVLVGRFVAFLRILIALLAGASRMPWHSFTFYNALGGTLWGLCYVLIPYELGSQIDSFTGPVGLGFAAFMLSLLVGSFFLLRHHEKTLIRRALIDEKRLKAKKSRKRPSLRKDSSK
ncbi:DedA family protein [Bombella sp. ESL0385]|uniref:DedA family protein n=1 Tax=Bombella sp. ESL0385 TaxID=2676446 RepID=UPI00351BEB2D